MIERLIFEAKKIAFGAAFCAAPTTGCLVLKEKTIVN